MTALDNYVAPTSLEQAVVQLQELGEVTIQLVKIFGRYQEPIRF